ncbi:unknown [Bacteroides faecis CAG:32]|nr:unknown [Bacteroides faecis CAG:32]
MGADMGSGVMILHFHPCQRIGNLAGGGDSVPRTGHRVFVVGIGGIESSGRIERFLKVYQIVVLLDRAEHTQFAVQKTVKHLLGHVHIGSEVLHVFIQNDSLTIHETEGYTVAGFIGTAIEGDVMVLLQSCLLNFFLEVGTVAFVENRDAPFGSDSPEVICRQHIQVLVDGGYSEDTVVAHLRLTAHPFLRSDFDDTGGPPRSVL